MGKARLAGFPFGALCTRDQRTNDFRGEEYAPYSQMGESELMESETR